MLSSWNKIIIISSSSYKKWDAFRWFMFLRDIAQIELEDSRVSSA